MVKSRIAITFLKHCCCMVRWAKIHIIRTWRWRTIFLTFNNEINLPLDVQRIVPTDWGIFFKCPVLCDSLVCWGRINYVTWEECFVSVFLVYKMLESAQHHKDRANNIIFYILLSARIHAQLNLVMEILISVLSGKL